MSTNSCAPLIAELETVLKTGSSQRRVEIFRRVTDLFLSGAERYAEPQVGVFDDVLVHLMAGIEARTLSELSSQYADLGIAPRQAVLKLAGHEEIAVAGP